MKETPAHAAARSLRRSIRKALLLRAAAVSLTAGLLVAGGSFLALRTAAPDLPRLRLLPWTALPAALLFAFAALRIRRHIPSRERCLAAVEAASHAGGLALCADAPGAEAWRAPETVVPAARFRPSRALVAALACAAAFCALSLALPSAVFRRILPQPPGPSGIQALAAREEQRLDDLLDAGDIPPDQAAELREWLDRVREGVGDSSQAALLEALDHVARKLDEAAVAAAESAVAQQNALLAAEAVASSLAEAAQAAGADAPTAASPADGAPGSAAEALAGLQAALPLSDEARAQLSAALPSATPSPSPDTSDFLASSALDAELRRRLAELFSKLPPETLRAYADALQKGEARDSLDTSALSMIEKNALLDLLEQLSPKDIEELTRLFSSLSTKDLENLLKGAAASPNSAPPEMMSAEEFRAYIDRLRALSSLSSNELARLARQNPGCCSNPKFAPLPSPQAALDALLAQRTAAAKAAADALSLCHGAPGAGNPSRGPGDAPLGFTGTTSEADPEDYRTSALPPGGGLPDPSAGAVVGTSAADPDVAPDAAPVAPGALDDASASPDDAGDTRRAPVLPRHQKAVQSYFGDDPP